ncbi:molybdopterin-guanine dinucleotide biosynthesis protein A [Clostridium botulinum]|uniref:Molybdopterin-guanine dinucleotide biosynthesis protein A n=1 Tax=Clostridium botulinum TaxID=1491 RepID=A0AAU8Z5L0_CLOBO|nr:MULTISPECIES: ERCC4 domain-containing protein [Clostridium]AVP66325.1 molybdopterin-guanine dinucleotide biosynthesis protein A [Clostridium botulinum]MBA4507926.1 ERCC4 domain-containing protein [Clostridium sporogenes]MBO0555304.1 molybdopterin-guanine dinucleotide biosynthesis protein A [Clostridium botulinum]MCW6061463.1 ERCC4 domain-containing protein [Clostridium sporogenes]MCW6066857.1 ERCC4 domain-containing protein [Clostridium sporogenes]
MYYKFTDIEIKKLLKENFMILYDTREQKNQHVLDYLDSKKVPYKKKKIDEGDYTAIVTKCPEMGIYRDIYFPVAVERKNSVDELANNLGEKTDTRDDIRLIREFQRAKTKGIKISLIIEDKNGMENIKKGNYRSLYKPKAFLGRLSSIQDLYLHDTLFVDRKDTGFEIYRKLYYSVRNYLKELNTDIGPAVENE